MVDNRLKDSKYVVLIVRHQLDRPTGAEILWYLMPIATGLRAHLEKATKLDVVNAMLELAIGLSDLHANQVAHCDIKPENLFFFEKTFRFGDLGIAKFPESVGLTATDEPMGPQGYVADEMLRDSASADSYNADVFSLAKTLWGLITKRPFPFLGQYFRRERNSLDRLLAGDDFIHEPLDDLLEACTHSDPDERPTADALAKMLRELVEAQGCHKLLHFI